jgi:formylglycine-generating enzyme required for sulfatase activity
LRGAGKWLLLPLADFLVDEKRSVVERGMIATVYGTYAAELPDAYARLDQVLAEQSGPGASEGDKVRLARRQAGIGTALLVMGRAERVWPLLRQQPDPTLRSYLIDRAGPGGVDAKVLIERLDQEKEVSVRQAIVLSLGEYGLDRLSPAQRENIKPRLLQLHREDGDPGIHGAAEWLLRQWGMKGELTKIEQELATGKVEGKREWYVNGQGQTMVVLLDAGEFWMGEDQGRHRQKVGRSFAVASKEVTVEQFLRFRQVHQYQKEFAPKTDCPVNSVTWYDAAAYCNWLSDREGIPKDQWCYEANKDGKYAEGMRMAPNYLQRTGYRLPTEEEWEYACRAGSETAYSFGEPMDLLGKYAWYQGNSLSQSQSVGTLRPNEYGLFDMHGNAGAWTQSAYEAGKGGRGMTRVEDVDNTDIKNTIFRVLRGGSFTNHAPLVRSANRLWYLPTTRSFFVGFRPARTFTP